MKLRYIAMLAIFLLPFANAAIEKPSWSIGSYWEYNGNIRIYADQHANYPVDNTTYETSMTVDYQMALNLFTKVDGVTIEEKDGEVLPCYIMKLNVDGDGNGKATIVTPWQNPLTGKIETYTIKFNLDVNLTATGEIYLTTENLSVVSNDLTTDIYVKVTLEDTEGLPDALLMALNQFLKDIQLQNNTISEYSPPLDFLNFPIKKGEEWTTSTTVKYIIDGKEREPMDLEFTFTCIEEESNSVTISTDYLPFLGEITVDVGWEFGFPPIRLLVLNNTKFIWSDEIGMIERIWNYQTFSEENQTFSEILDLSLADYSYSQKENIPPVAKIDYSPKEIKAGRKVTFESKSYDEDGSIVYYLWEFGDGKKSNDQNPIHTYTKPGNYTVTLTVIDNYGNKATTSIKITVAKGEGGGGTPGFEFIAILIALLIVLWRRMR